MAKPLRILVIGPVTHALSNLGDAHSVEADQRGLDQYDLILGPTCCRFVPGMEPFLPAVIKGARKVKYPAKEKT